MVTCMSTYFNVFATSLKIVCKAWSACKVILSEKSKYFLSFQLSSFGPNGVLVQGMLVQLMSHVTRQDIRRSLYYHVNLSQDNAATLSL